MLFTGPETSVAAANTTDLTDTMSVDKSHQPQKRLLEDTFDIAPIGLKFCFDRECFLNEDFRSDEFILDEASRGTSLEQMRDSLLQYSNILKSSLVELINQDYADFVNLSTNLVGLDKAIDLITNPLAHLESSVQNVLQQLCSVETQLSAQLEERQKIREKKELLNSLQMIDSCVTRLERWLSATSADSTLTGQSTGYQIMTNRIQGSNKNGVEDKSKSSLPDVVDEDDAAEWPAELYADCSLHEDPGQRIDRVANEFIKLQFLAKKCHDHPILQSLKPRIQWITSTLHEQLEDRLKTAFDACQLTSATERPTISNQSGIKLRQALSTYLIIDRLADVIDLYRRYVLRPKLSKIFVPRSELVSKGSETPDAVRALDQLHTAALEVLDHQLNILQQLKVQRSSESYDPLTEFNCIIDGFWPETVDLLCTNLSEMFAPGDPDRFYALYTSSLRFLADLESRLNGPSAVRELRSHMSYAKYSNKWNRPVYFQIRFQDIAGCVENVMERGLEVAESPSSSTGCVTHLVVTQVIIKQLERCWSDGIYLTILRHRFWRLTLQILTRYHSFVVQQINTHDTSVNLNAAHAPVMETLKPFLFLMIDCSELSTYVSTTLAERIRTILGPVDVPTPSHVLSPTWLADCLNEFCERILQTISPLQNLIVDKLQFFCLNVSRQILDVPRQYRRTNRDIPTTHSAYVSAMISPLSDMAELCASITNLSSYGKTAFKELINRTVVQVADAYQGQLHELLSSVKKMEDSLRKLREARLGANSSQTLLNSGTGTYSDDDKIRQQLYLDACSLRDQAKDLWGINEDTIAKLEQTVRLVEAAKREAAGSEH